MNKIINYFLENSRLNYTLLALILVMGIFAYIKIPKEIFPSVSLDSINITGSYSGASADSLNNFAVSQIEDEIESISGLKKVTSTIKSGSFSIKIELQEGENQNDIFNKIKDAVSNAKRYFPSDMNEPSVTNAQREMPLLNISLSSNKLSKKQLVQLSKKLKTNISQVDNISSINIYGDSDLQIDIFLDHKKIKMYNLNSSSVIDAISQLSYIYPIGKIEELGNHIYLSANNDKFNLDKWRSTLLEVDNKKIYLGDIAKITIDYPIDETISRFNGKTSIALNIYKDDMGDSIKVAKNVRTLIKEFLNENKNISIDISNDTSEPINDRIHTILSNITLGLVLVGLSIYVLISPRLSLVIILGIPFSFIIGLTLIETMGYSLNMISLMAMLITLGIVVDDAIIVSENIQRHLDEGLEIKEAVLKGTKQVIAPVLIASFTTMFAFLPMLLISGEMGLLIKLVPIVIIILIIASLLESFLFLPLHAKHILKRKEKLLDWSPIYNKYENILHKIIHYKKTFLIVFFISVPILILLQVKNSRYQMFPDMDTRKITISAKYRDSTALEQTDNIAKIYEREILKNKQALYLKSINTTVGSFTQLSQSRETIENGFTITVQLEDLKEDNIVSNYINPILDLSFDFEQKDKIRLLEANEIMYKLRELTKPLNEKTETIEFNLITEGVGVVKTDIELKFSAKEDTLLISSIKEIEEKLSQISGVKDISDNTQLGQKEYKYTINNYGQNLGLSDKKIATALNSYFMQKEQTNTFNKEGIIKINTQSLYKDYFEELQNFLIPLNDSKFIQLKEVVDFKIERNFEKLEKENGNTYKKVFANIDKSKTSANEVLKALKPALDDLEKKGVNVSFGGEQEKNADLTNDMTKASIVALFLIFITLLINFPSFKSAFIIISVIPFTVFGALLGHTIMGINISALSIIGILGLAGVVINDGIIMLDFLHETKNKAEFFKRAKQRVRPILITSITTILGLSTLIFFPSGEAVMLQPISVSLGFGIAWGTVLNLIYVPALYAVAYKIKD